ncbi:MAG: copper-translocating P-type ATPase [Bacteroidetes bacterium]|nr:copper-translocating P-type ATPase [Bacteroidota bacterium]
MKTQTFYVKGMTCASCASSVESILQSLDAVESASVNFADNSVNITWDDTLMATQNLASRLKTIGYELIIDADTADLKSLEEDQLAKSKLNMQLAALMGLPVFVLGMFFMHGQVWVEWVSMVLTVAIMVFPGRRFYINAVKRAKHRQANMDTLVALSTSIAFLYSFLNTIYPEFIESYNLHADVYYESAAVIIAFILLGKYLEESAKSRSRDAIASLMQLQPNTVTVIRNGETQQIQLKEVHVNDRILVRTGDRIPVDGLVVNGSALVNESMITGEPEPVLKERKDELLAGTLNENGSLTMLAKKVGADTYLSAIINAVKAAQGSKAPAQKRADKIAGIFVPIVLFLALITAGLWLVFGGIDMLPNAINCSVAVLVIACPCALGLATPTALMVGLGNAAKKGILIKDATQLETAGKLQHVVFDKTGTLTIGQPKVVQEYVLRAEDLDKVLAIEKTTQHPLSKALIEHLNQQHFNDEGIEIKMPNTVKGLGVSAEINGELYCIGKPDWVLEQTGFNRDSDFLPYDFAKDKTVVFAAKKEAFIAAFAIEDELKPAVKDAITTLKKEGLQVHLLSGDKQFAVAQVAKKVGIDNIKAEVLPAQKAEYIKSLQQNGQMVAMVGDGINDAEALATANVSIAMASGTNVAIDSAGITLLHGHLSDVSKAIKLSKATASIMNQNLFWAFIYNIIGIPIAAGILYPFDGFLLNPMIAGAAMAFSSVSVVLNSLRLRGS